MKSITDRVLKQECLVFNAAIRGTWMLSTMRAYGADRALGQCQRKKMAGADFIVAGLAAR